MSTRSQHSQQDFPRTDTPFVDPAGAVAQHWYVFLRSLWVKTGSGFSSTGTAAYLQIETDGTIGCYNALTGIKLGKVVLS